tara:strand:+ start:2428 stop:3450 length:1023 start_codon:yes stop_codon:yes gene_type:complete
MTSITLLYGSEEGLFNNRVEKAQNNYDKAQQEVLKQQRNKDKTIQKHEAERRTFEQNKEDNRNTLYDNIDNATYGHPNRTYEQSIQRINDHLTKVTGQNVSLSWKDSNVFNKAEAIINDHYRTKTQELTSKQKQQLAKHNENIEDATYRANEAKKNLDSLFELQNERTKKPDTPTKSKLQAILEPFNNAFEWVKRFFGYDFATQQLKELAATDNPKKERNIIGNFEQHLQNRPGQEARLGNAFLKALAMREDANNTIKNNIKNIQEVQKILNLYTPEGTSVIIVHNDDSPYMPETIEDIVFKLVDTTEIEKNYDTLDSKYSKRNPIYINKQTDRKNITYR